MWVKSWALVMRFDDDALRLFGPGLVGLTATPEFIPNSERHLRRTGPGVGHHAGAAVVEGLTLTL